MQALRVVGSCGDKRWHQIYGPRVKQLFFSGWLCIQYNIYIPQNTAFLLRTLFFLKIHVHTNMDVLNHPVNEIHIIILLPRFIFVLNLITSVG